jgi:hypothetical protein
MPNDLGEKACWIPDERTLRFAATVLLNEEDWLWTQPDENEAITAALMEASRAKANPATIKIAIANARRERLQL